MTSNRLLKALILCPLLLLLAFAAQAQKTVTGKITDEKGNPIPGASIVVKDGKVGTTTDASGSFTLNAPSGTSAVTVSYVGYVSQDIDVTSTFNISVSLVPDNSSLTDVVVVGYGTARRKDLTGAVASVKEKDFNKGVITSPDQLIQGKASGVMVMNNMGQPGGSTTIRIRGTSSIRSNNNPLFVVDGIPLSGGSARPGEDGGSFGSDPGNPLSFINPADIANIEILKDASATAIYGSRGANGVVIVTTKRGQSGAPKLDLNASTGISNYLKKIEVLNTNQYRQALKDYDLENDQSDGGANNVDAWDAITRTAVTQNYSVAVGGGNENGRYRLSASYLDQQGIIETSELKKLTASFNSSFKFLESKKLGLDINILVSQNNERIAPVNTFVGFEGNVISQALQWNPTFELYNDDGTIYNPPGTTINPLASLAYYKDKAAVNTILASISPSYKITNSLEYKFLYSVNRQVGVRKGMGDQRLNLNGIKDVGVAFINNNQMTNQQITNTLSFNKEVSSLNINAVIGHEWLIYDNAWNAENGHGFTSVPVGINYYDVLGYSQQSDRSINAYDDPTTEIQSFFARAILNFKDKYLVTGTIRADGSTRFGKNNKYGYFPSIGVAWNASNEEFLSGSNVISYLKVRASWGETGNQEFPSGASLNRFDFGQQSISRSNFGNPDLRWETSATADGGIDFGFFDNRLTGTVDYFYKKTTDVLFERELAQPAPSGKIWVNLPGYVLNKGLELSLTGNIIRQKDLNWNITGNASFLTNKVQGLIGFYETGNLQGQGFTNVRGQRVISGQPLDVWYLGKWTGIDKSTGLSTYEGGDPAANKFYLGSPNPKTLLGLSTDISYKKFSAVINMNGALGQYLFNNTAATVLAISNLGSRNLAKTAYDVAKREGESTSDAAAPSDRFLEKGNYFKMANATIAYNVGNIGKVIKNLNISLTGQNLFVITKYSGFDPEVNTDGSVNGIPSLGIDYIPYPSARTILLGVNFSL